LVYDVVIDSEGNVSSVSLARPFREEPPWTELHNATVEAIRKWKYEPTLVEGVAVPVCLTVTVTAEVG
jgi:TonB family protein